MGFSAFLDFEFSQGSHFPKEEIISVGCVILDKDYKEVDSFYSLCRPKINNRIPKRITRITKIYQRDVDQAPNFVKMMNSFVKKLDKYPGIKFYSWGGDDWKVFKEELEVNKCPWFKNNIPEIIDLQIEIFDSIKNGDGPLWRSPKKLTAMTAFYNVKALPAHNALNDARMLGEIYKAKKLRGKYYYDRNVFQRMDTVTPDDLVAASQMAWVLKTNEKQSTMKRRISSYGRETRSRILDGNLYHMVEPYLDKPLFEQKKRRNYSDYIAEIALDQENLCLVFKLKSKDRIITRYFDIEEYNMLIMSLLHMFCGNRKRQKNWK